MMHELEMPPPLASLQIDGNDALCEQVIAGPMAAVEVRCRRFNGQVRNPQIFIDRNLIPYADVTVDRP
jgi:hypothetical protein